VVRGLLEQIAKEMGGIFTNRQEITGAGGGAIKTENTQVPPMPILTPEELATMTPQELSRLVITGKK
jgi:hypothetical protein